MGQTFCIPVGSSGLKYSKPVGVPLGAEETAAYRTEGLEKLLTGPIDECKTGYDIFQHGLEISRDSPCVGFKTESGVYEWLTYAELFSRAKSLGSGLMNMNLCPLIEHADEQYKQSWRFIGVMTKNRVEFSILEQASNCYGLTLVPVYDTLGPDTLNYICSQTKMTSIIASNDALANIVKSVQSGQHDLKNILLFTAPTDAERELASSVGLTLFSFDEVEKNGADTEQMVTPPSASDINTFCYTSGTTGMPKGAMISHGQLAATVGGVLALRDLDLNKNDVHLSYLPCAHILERIVDQCFFYLGARIGYYGGDTLKIVDDAQALKPTVFVSVPRLYNRIYDKVIAGAEAAGGLKKKLFHMALNSKLQNLHQTATVTHSFWDKLVFAKPKAILGGNVRVMLTGAAPIASHVHDALKCIFCVPIAEGFGMTESCGATCISRLDDPVTGHVGGPVGCAEIKLISVPEMGYSVHDQEDGSVCPRGEICINGPSVFPGYFKDADKTAEAFDTFGWLKTGDIGVIKPNGSLKIIDRRKNIFKLAQGEYVAAEKIEIVYQQAASIGQVFIYGKSTEIFIIAIVVPDFDFAKIWWKEHNNGTEYPGNESVCTNKEFIAKIQADMKQRETEDKLNGFEKARKIHLSPEAFTVENNLLTPTFKLKRKETREKYQTHIDQMYAA